MHTHACLLEPRRGSPHSRQPHPAKARTRRATGRPPPLFLCFSSLYRRRAVPTCELESGHLYSIPPICTFALPSSRRLTLHSHGDARPSANLACFHRRAIKVASSHGRGQPCYHPSRANSLAPLASPCLPLHLAHISGTATASPSLLTRPRHHGTSPYGSATRGHTSSAILYPNHHLG